MSLWKSVLLKYIQVLHQLYPLKVNALKERLSQNSNLSDPQKVKVAFFVTLDSKFAAKPLFEKMLKDDLFDPIIVTIPVVGWCGGGKIKNSTS